MKKLNKFNDKLLEFAPGGVYGLTAITIYILSIIISSSMYSGYSIFLNMISDLGVGEGALIFNTGIVISGFVSMPFYTYLGKVLKSEIANESVRKGAIISSMISCVFYSLIGVFPSIKSSEFMIFLHGTVAFISWSSGAAYLLFFSLLFMKDSRFTRFQAYLGFFIIGTYVIFLLTWWPITEWIASFGITIWIILNACYTLSKKFK